MALGQRGDGEEDKELLVEGARSNRGFRAQQSLPSVPNNVRTAPAFSWGLFVPQFPQLSVHCLEMVPHDEKSGGACAWLSRDETGSWE